MYAEEKLYKRGIYVRHNPNDPSVPSVEVAFREMGIEKNIPIIADSEDPLAIKEIKSLGYNIIPATKGKGSVKDGIELMRKFAFHIVAPSDNLLIELSRYKWRTSKDNIQLGEPSKGFDHLIDPWRYVCLQTHDQSGFISNSNVRMESVKIESGVDQYDGLQRYDDQYNEKTLEARPEEDLWTQM